MFERLGFMDALGFSKRGDSAVNRLGRHTHRMRQALAPAKPIRWARISNDLR